MTFVEELKRRNVIKVAVAYVVVAWLVMQFSDVILNNIEAPGWVFQVIMLVLGIGFALALFFAWAFEMTPEGIKREESLAELENLFQQGIEISRWRLYLDPNWDFFRDDERFNELARPLNLEEARQ